MISYLPPLFFFSFLWGGEGWGGLLPLAHLLYNSHLHGTWQPPVVFAGEEKNKTALVKIFLSQNCLSAKTPARDVGMDAAKDFASRRG